MLWACVQLSGWLVRAELGDLATWIGALANVATLAFALVASVVGLRVYRIESGRDRRAEDERRERRLDEKRAQASLVSAWLAQQELEVITTRSSDSQPLLRPRPRWGVNVLNASTAPIYHVIVFYRWSANPYDAAAGDEMRVVPPHQGGIWQLLPESIRRRVEMDVDPQFAVDVAVEFRDAAGRWWRRGWDGLLSEAPDRA
ncbi:hypothetical protein JNW91_02590 [Micromonospora sp. STR1_7]|uniref:Uncharacterized protein n=1 Tax=Micromonospora parastrephiae TaxID=2806101 RepID=A0ABS1XNM4_9ACTN|nr:hypothetical protein [Micromonospora parastrephiae]MBM0230861.1 hypothetical protein [Micromonospora parastrephiae]